MSERLIGSVVATNSEFKWEVHNFSTIEADMGKFVYSPTFTTCYCDESSNKIHNLHWRLQLYPSGGYMGNCNKNFISAGLENLDALELSTKFSLALLDKLNMNVIGTYHSDKRSFGEKKSWGWHAFVKKELILDEGSGCLINDTLTVSCHIYSTSVTNSNEKSDQGHCLQALLSHFEMLFATSKFSDLTIRIGKQELRAHKSVVTSSSSVFRAMFENQMKEQNENIIDIVDIEFDTMKEMLRYMYTRKVNGIENIASDLFVAANKYCVEGLKELCEKTLCEDLDAHNALQRLEMAVQYNMKELKPSSIKFILITENLKSFCSTKELKELSSECKIELFDYITEKIGNRT